MSDTLVVDAQDWIDLRVRLTQAETALSSAQARAEASEMERQALYAKMEAHFDCHAGPGTTTPACGACTTCAMRDRDAAQARAAEADKERDELNDLVVLYVEAVLNVMKVFFGGPTVRSVTAEEAKALSALQSVGLSPLPVHVFTAERERDEARMHARAAQARAAEMERALVRAVEAIDRAESDRHSPWCNGVHEQGMCEGDVMMSRFMEELRALLSPSARPAAEEPASPCPAPERPGTVDAYGRSYPPDPAYSRRKTSRCACGHLHSTDSDGAPGPCREDACACLTWCCGECWGQGTIESVTMAGDPCRRMCPDCARPGEGAKP